VCDWYATATPLEEWRWTGEELANNNNNIMIQSLSILVVRWLSTLLLFHVPSTTTSSSCCCCCSTLLCFHRRTLPAPRKSTRSLGGSVDYLVVSFFTILFCFVALNPLLSLSRSLALSLQLYHLVTLRILLSSSPTLCR
jgi:hypothetical protein